ncbi:MAG TPA: hypothetical protein VK961_16980 [Chthoniobacter sp.]|nr:hypothetical protein [Chthoniobacter sp.]
MSTDNHYDFIIIGIGAGGGTLAWKIVPSTAPMVRSPIDIATLPLGSRRAGLVRDPDGHALQFTEP